MVAIAVVPVLRVTSLILLAGTVNLAAVRRLV